MHPKFPKTLTIELPELLREALREISKREPHLTPARLLERLLAVGIASKLKSCADSSTSGEDDGAMPDATSAEPLHVRLNSGQTARVLRIVGGGAQRTPEEVAMWMLEWGLDAYAESLQVIEPTDVENGVGVR